MRTILALIVLSLSLAAAEVARPLKPAEGGVGRLVADAAFTDLAGKSGALAESKSSKFLVIAITNDTCPLCKKYAPTLAKMEAEFAGKGSRSSS